jgi:2-polyprenyl-6-methoxyphenol hydroxylase-like FAD-dependent oxidoreductase
MTFYHPRAQEAVLEAAQRAGAEVRRGARVTGVTTGAPVRVSFEVDGKAETAPARLVAGADGRGSMVRKWAGFESKQDADQLWLAGLLFEGMASPEDTSVLVFNPFQCRDALIFPQGGGRARCYFGARTDAEPRLQGERDVPRFIELSIEAGLPAEYFANAVPQGPLATFPGADSWVDHPYHDGVALVGDAASHGDQTWGQGMSMTFRDTRMLRDELLADDDWDRAGHAYAERQHAQFAALHKIEDWFTRLFMDSSPEATAARMKALPHIAQDGSRIHDGFVCGPDSAPTDEAARRRFFGEE